MRKRVPMIVILAASRQPPSRQLPPRRDRRAIGQHSNRARGSNGRRLPIASLMRDLHEPRPRRAADGSSIEIPTAAPNTDPVMILAFQASRRRTPSSSRPVRASGTPTIGSRSRSSTSWPQASASRSRRQATCTPGPSTRGPVDLRMSRPEPVRRRDGCRGADALTSHQAGTEPSARSPGVILRWILGGRSNDADDKHPHGVDNDREAASVDPDAEERQHELDLLRAEAQRLDELTQRQPEYADYVSRPPRAASGDRTTATLNRTADDLTRHEAPSSNQSWVGVVEEEPTLGFEPRTCCLRNSRSTTEAMSAGGEYRCCPHESAIRRSGARSRRPRARSTVQPMTF